MMDQQAFLRRIGGDQELAHTLVGILLDTLPDLQAAVAGAVKSRQARDLERSAHALRGALATFSAAPALEAAERLEGMGRASDALDPEGCDAAHALLQSELSALEAHLRRTFSRAPS